MYEIVGVFYFHCEILGHRSTDCTILVGRGSKCKIVAITGGGAMQENSMAAEDGISEDGISEVMTEDIQKSPSKVHVDGHMGESSLSGEEGESSPTYMGHGYGIGEAEEKEGLGTAIENKVVSKLSWQFNIESDRYEESAVG